MACVLAAFVTVLGRNCARVRWGTVLQETDTVLCSCSQFAVSAVLSVARGLLSRRQDDLDD